MNISETSQCSIYVLRVWRSCINVLRASQRFTGVQKASTCSMNTLRTQSCASNALKYVYGILGNFDVDKYLLMSQGWFEFHPRSEVILMPSLYPDKVQSTIKVLNTSKWSIACRRGLRRVTYVTKSPEPSTYVKKTSTSSTRNEDIQTFNECPKRVSKFHKRSQDD